MNLKEFMNLPLFLDNYWMTAQLAKIYFKTVKIENNFEFNLG